MIHRALIATLALAVAPGTLTLAQPPDSAVFPGDERPRHERWQDDRLDRLVGYLELSEAQSAEWQAIAEEHTEAIRALMERVGSLREEFAELADQQDPNLEQLGRIALDMHRAMELSRSSRGELVAELEEILTPEQAERFATLKAAREFSSQRGRGGSRGAWKQPDSN